MTTPPLESAAAVLGEAPELPRGTPAAGAAAPAAAPATDRTGAVHDPAVHESPPRLNAERKWARRRGNAIRKAAGLPMTGVARTASPGAAPPPPPVPAAEPAAPAPEPAPTASQPPPDALLSGGPPPVDGVDIGPEAAARPFEDYEPTARGLVKGTFGIATLTMGKAWELNPEESRTVTGATQRVLHHYQLPVLGPILELILVLIPVLSRRRNDPDTRSAFQRLMQWWKERGQPVRQADPYRTTPAPGSSAPADAVPAAYRSNPAPPPSNAGKLAWMP